VEGPGRVCTLVGIYRALDDVDGAVGEDAEEGVLQVQQADAVDAPVRRAEEQLARVRVEYRLSAEVPSGSTMNVSCSQASSACAEGTVYVSRAPLLRHDCHPPHCYGTKHMGLIGSAV